MRVAKAWLTTSTRDVSAGPRLGAPRQNRTLTPANALRGAPGPMTRGPLASGTSRR